MAEAKKSNKERLREITEGIEQGIKELFESEKYRQYLSTMSRFHRYSVNNVTLIHMQMPNATHVAGYNKWRDQFERHVKRGEHGITIIAPTPFKKKIEEQKLDPDTRAPMLDADGKVITEEKEIEIPMFRPVKVFDVSQTEGKPLPQLASDLTGNVQQFDAFMEALRRAAPVPMTIEPMQHDMDGFFSPTEQRIAIRAGMSEVQTVSAAVHEIAHSKLHNDTAPIPADAPRFDVVEIFGQPALFEDARIDAAAIPDGLFRYELRGSDDDPGMPVTLEQKVIVNHAGTVITAKPLTIPEEGYLLLTEDNGLNFVGGEMTMQEFQRNSQKDRYTEEVEAESISYTVCQYYGIQTGENSFGYIATWSKGKELAELRASLETINKTASGLITDIDRHFKEICKERGIDLTAPQEPERDAIAELAAQLDQLSFDYDPYEYRDRVDDREQAVAELTQDISAGNVQHLRDWLQSMISEQNENGPKAQELLDQLNVFALEATVPEQLEPDIKPPSEQLCLLDDAIYLHLQTSDNGWDYTLYDKETLRQLDGGQLDRPDLPISTATLEICQLHDMGSESIKLAPLAMIETLQAAAEQQMQSEAAQWEADHIADISVSTQTVTPPIIPAEALEQSEAETAAAADTLPDAPEQALDEYPIPDEQLRVADLEACGYMDGDMLPLSKERAMELYDMDLTVYAIVGGGSAEMLFDQEEFETQVPGTVFAISREEWEESPMFHEKIMERHDQQAQREAAFLSHEGDCFAIYQVKHDDAQRDIRYEGLDWLKSIGRKVEHENYDLVYTAPLPDAASTDAALDALWYQFNNEHPADYHHPSMSVSDIVAIKRDGEVSCHYCDSFGFQEVPGFLPQDNPLKNAEMSMEDDYGMIDGMINNGSKEPTVAQLEQQARSGQPISLMDLAGAVHREQRDKKKSVVEQLRTQPKQEHKKPTPKKNAEREI